MYIYIHILRVSTYGQSEVVKGQLGRLHRIGIR